MKFKHKIGGESMDNNMSNYDLSFEQLGPDYQICVSKEHKFGTDSFLISHFANIKKHEKCCDLGTGCGIIPLLWYRWGRNPEYAYAVEIQQQGYDQMLVTIEKNHLEDKLRPIHSDLKELKGKIANGSLDAITCNPPYKMEGHGVPCPDATRLTARHEVACTLDDICKTSAQLLRFGGRLCICQRPERLPDIITSMRNHKIEPKRLRFVQKHGDTQPWLLLIEGKKGGKPFLQVEAPLIVEDGNGKFSQEMLDIYGFTKNEE